MVTIYFKDGDIYKLHPKEELLLSWNKRFIKGDIVNLVADGKDAKFLLDLVRKNKGE